MLFVSIVVNFCFVGLSDILAKLAAVVLLFLDNAHTERKKHYAKDKGV